MDDFLHNLRSGKLKQGDRSNRSYNDPQYKGGPRRNTMDRRKGHFDNNKESSERLNAIKEVLENLTESQKRMAEAYKARTRAEERKATAMEIIAKSLYQMANPNANDTDTLFAKEPGQSLNFTSDTNAAESETSSDEIKQFTDQQFDAEKSEELLESDEIDETVDEDIDEDMDELTPSGRLTELDRQTLHTIIGQMRENGEGWEKIARHIAAQGYPTASGKGSWRGVMVKTLYEKLAD